MQFAFCNHFNEFYMWITSEVRDEIIYIVSNRFPVCIQLI